MSKVIHLVGIVARAQTQSDFESTLCPDIIPTTEEGDQCFPSVFFGTPRVPRDNSGATDRDGCGVDRAVSPQAVCNQKNQISLFHIMEHPM